MFTIREFEFDRDSEKVAQLLRNEFGPQFTMDFFRWKHQQNPFGSSFGLVAVNESNEVIGVRLFMWWKFIINNQLVNAIRPVDTTTDKNYRGMGIFKKLTLQGIEELKEKYDFIFNTPNNNSLPGYLKMGWQLHTHPFNYYLNPLNPFSGSQEFEILDDLNKLPQFNSTTSDHTLQTTEYIKWRYTNKVYKKALFNKLSSPALIVYKIKTQLYRGLRFKILIIIDVLGEFNSLSELINSICKFEKAWFYYFAGFGNTSKLRHKLSFRRGSSVVAFRFIKEEKARSISFSTGDLEGVL